MLTIDLRAPFAALVIAMIIVIAVRAYAAWADREEERRTEALLDELQRTKSSRRETDAHEVDDA